MSSPNITVAASAFKSTPKTSSSSVFSTHTSGNDGLQIITIGKDTMTVPVPAMASINEPAYLKAACFGALSTAAYGLLETYPAASVMLFVTQQLPITTTLAVAEASKVALSTRSALLNVENLQACCFLKKDWTQATQKQTNTLKDRTAGIYAVRLNCRIPAHSLDSRINSNKTFETEFALVLPQHEFDSTHGTTSTHLTFPLKPKKNSSFIGRVKSAAVSLFLPFSQEVDKSTSTIPSSFDSTKAHFTGGPLDDDTSLSTAPSISSSSNSGHHSSTRIARAFEPASTLSTTKIGYYGDFDFLQSQESFNKCFGSDPKLWHATECSASWNNYGDLHNFSEECKFRIFMDICKIDYVGGDNISPETYVREICNSISRITQQWKDPKGRLVLDTPEEMFQKFMCFASRLPENTETWTTSLPSAFLNALHETINRKITSSSFEIPKPSSLHSRTDHINGMRIIKNEATRVYDEMQERHLEMEQGFSLFTAGNKRTLALYSNKSLAEETMEKYKGPIVQKPDFNKNSADVEIKQGSDGKSYPFHIPTQYLSQYPVGFRGCFRCGSVDHFLREQCPLSDDDSNFDRKKFFGNLWAHRPHTYTKRTSTPHQDNRKKQALVTTPDNKNSALEKYAPSNQRNVDNRPAWMTQQTGTPQPDSKPSDDNPKTVSWLDLYASDTPSKKPRAFVIRPRILQVTRTPKVIRDMPIECESDLPAIVLRLGSDSSTEIPVTFNLDSCAGMSTGNLQIHHYLITKFPECVHSYEEYNDANPFTPIALEGITTDARDVEEFEKGRLTALVTYKTCYSIDGVPQTLSFGLGSSIAVNGLIGLPQLRKWKIVMDFDDNIAISKNMQLQWNMEYVDAARGLPPQIQFDSSQFVRPGQISVEGRQISKILKVSAAPAPPTSGSVPSGPAPPKSPSQE